MSEMRSTGIDLDVHKGIELGRRNFAESDNDVLRRLLGIEGNEVEAIPVAASGRAWSGKGVTLPHGTRVRMGYNGRGHRGVIEDGQWLVEGTPYKSPSAAAGGGAGPRGGETPGRGGWEQRSGERPGCWEGGEAGALRGG